jgi:transposase-like protein
MGLVWQYETSEHILKKIHNVNVLLEKLSTITNAVMENATNWRNRLLGKSYAILYLDALHVKNKQDGESLHDKCLRRSKGCSH